MKKKSILNHAADQKFNFTFIYFVFLILVVFILFPLNVFAQETVIKINPDNQSVQPDTQFTVNVFVDKVIDLKGGSITIHFDPDQIHYSSASDGGFLPNSTVLEKKVDNTNGTVTIDIASLSGSSCGSGTILYTTFERIGSSPTTIDFGNIILRDYENSEMTYTKGSGSELGSCLGDFGSVDGGPPDGKVDFEDLMIFAIAYGSTSSDPNWNELCDIASFGGVLEPDGVIDFEDLMIFAMHYGEVCGSSNLPVKPVVSTQEATMDNNVVIVHGTIVETGGCDCGTRGFRYTTDPEHQGNIQEVHSEGGSFKAGSYSIELPPVTSNVTYYVQAYAANCVDTGYGNWVSFVFPSENPVHNVTQNTYHPTIQLAVDNANAEDVIECSPGTYVESIIVNKKLTILGAQHDVDPAGSLDRGNESIINPAGAKAFDVRADEVIINGFKITDASNGIYSEKNTVTASYNIMTDCSGAAIWANYDASYAFSNITASYNTINNCPKGINCNHYANVSADHNIIDRCLDYGIYSRGSSLVAEYNIITISDYGIYAAKGYSSGLVVTANYNTINTDNGIHLEGASVDLNYNTVTEAADGIYLSGSNGTVDHNTVTNCSNRGIYATGSTISAHYNQLYGNVNYGLYSADSNHALDATCNWWGSSSGPTHDGNPGGSGDAVSYHVTYLPFCTAEDCSSCNCTDLPVHNTIQDTYYSTIQEAVNAAGERDVIECQPGTYYENIVVTQGKLTILGAQHDVDPAGSLDRGNESIINPAGAKAFDVRADEVIINGFKITDASNGIYSEKNTVTASYNIMTDCSGAAIWANYDASYAFSNITASYNTINNCPKGINCNHYANVSADHNIIDRCLDYGIYSRGSSLVAEYNIITISDYGIYAAKGYSSGLVVTANYNKIYDNYEYGCYNDGADFDATHNWWGDSSGPSGDVSDPVTGRVADGTGDRIGANVQFDPFCTDELCSEFCFGAPYLSDPGEQVYQNQSYTLEWTSVEEASQYRVKESTDPNDFSGDAGYVISETSCEIVHSETGTFYYEVRAENEYNNIISPWSNIVDMEVIIDPDPVEYRAIFIGTDYNGTQQRHILEAQRMNILFNHCKYGVDEIEFSFADYLIDEATRNATRDEIFYWIDNYLGNSTDYNDILLFYMGCHGGYSESRNDYVLAPYDYDGIDTSKLISVSDLEEKLSETNIGGQKVIVILNSCQSGGFIGKGKDLISVTPEEFNNAVINTFVSRDMTQPSNRFEVITSCHSSESSYAVENEEEAYTWFAKYFLEGCNYEIYSSPIPADNNPVDGKVSLLEIYQYTYDRVLSEHSDQHVQVHPVNSNFTIVEY